MYAIDALNLVIRVIRRRRRSSTFRRRTNAIKIEPHISITAPCGVRIIPVHRSAIANREEYLQPTTIQKCFSFLIKNKQTTLFCAASRVVYCGKSSWKKQVCAICNPASHHRTVCTMTNATTSRCRCSCRGVHTGRWSSGLPPRCIPHTLNPSSNPEEVIGSLERPHTKRKKFDLSSSEKLSSVSQRNWTKQ